jgi:hypothetical protein
VKPIIPIGQAYDNYSIAPPYVLRPEDITSFVSIVKGYKSVNFWSLQHLLRDDCWAALRDAKVDPPTDEDLGRVVVTAAEEQPVEPTTEPPVSEVSDSPAPPVVDAVAEVQTPDTAVTTVEETPATEPEIVTYSAPEEAPTATPEPQHVVPQDKPQRVELPTSISVPVSSSSAPTTITFKRNPTDPNKVDIIVHPNKTHREYFLEFCARFIAFVQSLLKGRK